MKYLVVAALVALLLILVYSRLRPYLVILKKVLGTLNAVAGSSTPAQHAGASSPRIKSKLVKCVGCETWIPADRAIGSRVGTATFCSRECLEKSSNSKERKIAG